MSIFAERDAKWQKKLDAQAEKARKLTAQLRAKRNIDPPQNPFNTYALEAVSQDIRKLKQERTELLIQLQRREHHEDYDTHELASGVVRGLAGTGARSNRGGQLYR